MSVGCTAWRTQLATDSWTPSSWCHDPRPSASLPFRGGPKSARGLQKEAGKPHYGCHFLFWFPRAQRGGGTASRLSSSEHLCPRSPRPPRPAYSGGCPSLLTAAQGRNPPQKHLATAFLFCSESGPPGQTPINHLGKCQ